MLFQCQYLNTIMNYLKDVGQLYESVLILEMDNRVIDYLNRHKDKLPFDHIFGDKMRVAFPIGTDITAHSIMDDLRRIQHFDKVDLKKGEVVRKIKIDPKYGQGDFKEQKINIGKAISALKIAEEKKKKYLNWFALYKDNLESAFEKSEYVVVLTRSPVDVVRMSDHRNISSCHSRGSDYFQCAIQEAITGGAIAYIIGIDDFENLTEEDFQMNDLFRDSDRNSGIYGLRPLSRLRVRRLVDDDNNEVAIPDRQIYGDQSIPNFYNSLKQYLQSKQEISPDDFKEKYYIKRGGTYYDDSIRDLVAKYFNDEENTHDGSDFNRIYHDDDDTYGETSHKNLGLESELEEIKASYDEKLEYSEVFYHVEDDYFIMNAYSKIDVTKLHLPEDFVEEFDDIWKFKNGDYDDNENDIEWSKLYEYFDDKTYTKITKIELSPQMIKIWFDPEESVRDSSHFDSFCDDVRRFEDHIEDMVEDEDELIELFMEMGIINEPPPADKDFTMITDFMRNNEKFSNFKILGSRANKSFFIDVPHKYLVRNLVVKKEEIWDKIGNLSIVTDTIIKNMSNAHFKPSTPRDDSNQMKFDKFFESYVNPMLGIEFYVTGVTTILNYDRDLLTDKFQLKIQKMDNNNFEFVQFLNDMFPHIINALKLYCIEHIPNNEKIKKGYNYPALKRTYSKYL